MSSMKTQVMLLFAFCILAVLEVVPAFGQFATVGLGSRSTVVSGVNDAGEIVGTQNNIGNFDDVGFRIAPNSMPYPVGIFLIQIGITSVDANGVNSAGKIVGYYTDSFGTHGYLKVSETYNPIDYPGAVFTVANGVNDSDTVVGYYFDGTKYHGFRDLGGTLTTIDEPGASFTQIFGINNAGQISGSYSGGDCALVACGFVYQAGAFTKIVAPGAIATSVYGISNAGVVVGSYSTSNGFGHGFKESGGVFTNVDVPGADPGTTTVMGANSAGKLVGYYTKTIPGTFGGSILLGFVKKP
jgi:uncharacterized membrane protein